jgi:hypothetical protein
MEYPDRATAAVRSTAVDGPAGTMKPVMQTTPQMTALVTVDRDHVLLVERRKIIGRDALR